ncbi:MAG TPA: PQQ-dependent sugar dehydrogenase [Myxococcales bacterium]|nr:PQQ-dependent sugar dehydrogenase [Myxococcales bacterium]
MTQSSKIRRSVLLVIGVSAALVAVATRAPVSAQVAGPSLVDPNLAVRTVVTGLQQPTSMAFIGADDFLVLEKASGRVMRVVNGVVQGAVLDLAVNSASERGLLGIALHPDFPVAGAKHEDDDEDEDRKPNPGVYLYWTESTTGADSANLADVPLLGNRVDRFVWNGSSLSFDRNVIKLHAFQADAGQTLRGNHNGGVLKFGPDGKLYIVIGDNGRRGWMQNLPCGPTATCPGPTVQDDQFGGPAPDNAHLTGVILRLEDDGATPRNNPFFRAGAAMGGEVGANIQRVFAYGVRNTFGMDFDPVSGTLWLEENGDDSFTQLRRITAGENSGWVQIRGPVSRIAEYKAIETSPAFFGLQQIRWPPTNIANTPQEALARLFVLPGSHYEDPELSWKFEVAPAGIGFLHGRRLGKEYKNGLFMGGARTTLEGGHIFRFQLTSNRKDLRFADPRLEDRVADNIAKFDITESESLLFGRNFGIATDFLTGPNGNLFVVSLSNGAVYEVFRPQSEDDEDAED